MTTLLALALTLSVALPQAGPHADDLLRGAGGIPGEGLAPLTFRSTNWNPDAIHFLFDGPKKAHVKVVVRRAEEGSPAEFRLKRYLLDVTVTPAEAKPELAQAIARLVERIRTNQAHGPPLRSLHGKAPEKARVPTQAGSHDDRDDGVTTGDPAASAGETGPGLELLLCFAMLLGSILTAPWLIESCRRTLGGSRRHNQAFALSLGVLVLVQLVGVPHQLVTVFAGYGQVADGWNFEPNAKYGATTTALYGALLHLFGPSTEVIINTNLLVGLASVVLAAVWVLRVAGRAGRGGFGASLALLIIGFAPVLMHDRGTESVLLPMQFFLLAGLVHFDAWLKGAKRLHLLAAMIHWGLAMNARPEAFVVAPLLAGSVLALEGRWRVLQERKGSVVLATLLLLILISPRALSLLTFMDGATHSGDVPGLATGSAEGFWAAFLEKNGLWMPTLMSPWLLLGAVAAPFFVPRGRRGAAVLMWVAILAWQALSTLDLPAVSISRVQAPALSWAVMLAAVSVVMLLEHKRVRWGGVVAAGLCLMPWPGSAAALWAPTNAQVFDGFWERALPHIPTHAGKRCVIALSMSDKPRVLATRLYPLTSLKKRSGVIESYAIQTFRETPALIFREKCEPLIIIGPQCWAKFFGFNQPQPAKATFHPECQRLLDMTTRETIYEEELRNVGNADFPLYGATESFTYGVYRITGIKVRL